MTKYVSGSKTVDMQYDAKGIRISKSRNIASTTTNSTYIYDNGGKLRTEIEGSTTRNYIYGADGIVGYEENGEHFMYRKNFFGDIIAIYKGTEKVAEYVYDAWGNCTITHDVDGYSTRNPFRYRGYYFDNDLNMYYLLTRYYDPKIGRFINADTPKYLEPKTINGLNLYAYCGNNPIKYSDPSGCFPWLAVAALLLFTPLGGIALQAAVSVVTYVGMAAASLVDEDVKEDMKAIGGNLFNDNEDAVLNSKKVSFYKGVPVFRTDMGRSGSFYAIFLQREFGENDKNNTLHHERRHNSQAMMMGIFNYLFTVGIPSPLNLGGYAAAYHYNDAPWEAMANILGGTSYLLQEENSEQRAWQYYVKSMVFPILTIEYWF